MYITVSCYQMVGAKSLGSATRAMPQSRRFGSIGQEQQGGAPACLPPLSPLTAPHRHGMKLLNHNEPEFHESHPHAPRRLR